MDQLLLLAKENGIIGFLDNNPVEVEDKVLRMGPGSKGKKVARAVKVLKAAKAVRDLKDLKEKKDLKVTSVQKEKNKAKNPEAQLLTDTYIVSVFLMAISYFVSSSFFTGNVATNL